VSREFGVGSWENKVRQLQAKILANDKVAPHAYRMRVASAYLARATKPGQFFEVRCHDGTEPLLRRPFSCHRIVKGGVEILYEVVGRSTDLLSLKEKGEMLDVIGPIGNGFDLRSAKYERRSPILMAGGMGVAPLLALAEELAYNERRKGGRRKIRVLAGAGTKNGLLCVDDFRRLGCEVTIATDDGSAGKKGFITGCLKPMLSTMDYRLWTIYACGPAAMLEAAAKIASVHKIPCQVSLEERMACGVGVCLGCPVKVKTDDGQQTTEDGYKMVCKDGPVFDADDIAW
jgi:dihydroorotate dehydrogenase electron transfer subunit